MPTPAIPFLTDDAVDILLFLLEEPRPLSQIEALLAPRDVRSWQVENALGELFWADPQLARDDDEFVRDEQGRPEKQWRLKDPDWAKRVIRAYRPDFYLTAEVVPRLRPSALSV